MATRTTVASRIIATLMFTALCGVSGSSDAVLAASVTVGPPSRIAAVPAVRRPDSQTSVIAPVAVDPLADRRRAMVEWALERYAAASLDLPEVAVSFPTDRGVCHGADGRWEHVTGAADRVMICVTHEKPEVEEEWQRRALIHELAHAWGEVAIDAIDRQRFLALRGLEAWNDPGDEWGRRGTEHAAEIVSWGIIDQQIHMWKLPNASCPAMTAGYRLLTGMMPETGLPESCRP